MYGSTVSGGSAPSGGNFDLTSGSLNLYGGAISRGSLTAGAFEASAHIDISMKTPGVFLTGGTDQLLLVFERSTSYQVAAQAYKCTCYETDITRFAQGTGEQVADASILALKELFE